MRSIYAFSSEKGTIPKLCLLLILFFPSIGYTQSVQFMEDSIPVVDGKVVFVVDFNFDLDKNEFSEKAFYYLNGILDPYSGVFLVNSNESIVCEVVDYLDVSSNAFQVFGMYMTYRLQLIYMNGSCTMIINNITYMEKGYFEKQEESSRKLNMPEYSGKDIMIDKNYSRLMSQNASGKITGVTLERINEIIKGLEISFAQ